MYDELDLQEEFTCRRCGAEMLGAGETCGECHDVEMAELAEEGFFDDD